MDIEGQGRVPLKAQLEIITLVDGSVLVIGKKKIF